MAGMSDSSGDQRMLWWRHHRWAPIVLALIFCGLAPDATADDQAEVYGYKVTFEPGPKCVVDMDLDQSEFIDSVPQMKALGMLNPDFVTQTIVNTQPNALSMVYALQSAPGTIETAFLDDEKTTVCKFIQHLTSVDDYGHKVRAVMFTATITARTYKKIDFANFAAANLPKVADSFAFAPDFMAKVVQERGSGN